MGDDGAARLTIVHVVDRLDPDYGGPAHSVPALAAAQARRGHDVLLLHRLPREGGAVTHVVRDALRAQAPVRLRRVGALARLEPHLGGADVVHLHGFWDRLVARAALQCLLVARPYVLRPAGMLEPWALAQKRLKKRVALALVFRRILRSAALLHATADSEAASLRRLGLRGPISVVPNGLDVEAIAAGGDPTMVESRWPETRGRRRLLFLSRLHRKKGLDLLVEAWTTLAPRHADWHLVVAGPDEEGWRDRLEAELRRAGLAGRATFTGAVEGSEKLGLLRGCHAFVLPSYSENFGVVVAEALAAGLPVLTTTGTPWRDVAEAGCGAWVEPRAAAIAAGLDDLLRRPAEELEAMGARGRELVRAAYGSESVADRVLEAYRWLAGGRRPAHVHLCEGT